MPRVTGLSSSLQRRNNRRQSERRRHPLIIQSNDLLTSQRQIFGLSFKVARDPTVTEDLVQKHSVGFLSKECGHCHALYFEKEANSRGVYMTCCHNGKVVLPQDKIVRNGTAEIRSLLTDETPQSNNFRENIRNYNSALAFASMKSNTVQFNNRGPYVYKIHGQVYHKVSQLHPSDESARKYGQLYMIDSNLAVDRRLEFSEKSKLRRDVMVLLLNIVTENNKYASVYRKMADIEAEYERNGERIPELRVEFLKNKQDDRRRYNAPVANEIAGVFISADGGPPEIVDFVIFPRTGGMQNMKVTSSHVDPMCYPLLFVFGEEGWNESMPHIGANITDKRNKITMLQFYCHRLSIRPGFSLIHSGGKLFQQYIVDSYFKIEMNNLKYLEYNQQNLRAECYQGIVDALAVDSNVPVGKMVILPSSFTGSPRNMQQNYQDAMAIVRHFGKPDLFITFTCNPKWDEIVSNIPPWEDASNRPDLVSRVFRLKLKELMDDITKKHVLGKAIAYLYVIEFQKRGLPHSHILVTLRNEDKLTTRESIDSTIRGEIPDPITEPLLHRIVVKNLLHGPCGQQNPAAPCMENGVCTKGFPKQFTEETIENADGYPLYRRRNNGLRVTKIINGEEFVFDNRMVVPFNPYFTVKYNAHINVEACMSVKSIKYIHKYCYKGYDCSKLELTANGEYSEIKTYLNCRYISPPESAWRINEFKLHKQSHVVIKLAVHLPNDQMVYFKPNGERQAVENVRDTTLLAWFKLNQEDSNARQYRYIEIPFHYVFTANKKWKKRERRFETTVARMYTVPATDVEKYCLRVLLLHVKGATSFDDLKTVNGHVHSSFKEACDARGLLDDDNEAYNALDEASSFAMPRYLRFLFAVLCVFCTPKNVLQLWNTFREKLTEDLKHRFDESTAENLALQDIKQTLSLHNVNISTIGLRDPGAIILEPVINAANEKNQGDQYYSSLNEEQRVIVDAILDSVSNNSGGLYFIDGPGGTGKTHVYKTLIHKLRGDNKVVLPVAWTGIAATLLPGGRTCHSRFKFPVPLLETSTSSIRHNTHNALVLKMAHLIIWDEAPMAFKYSLNCLDLLLRDMTETALPFGGKCIVLRGDFRQVLPVVPRAPEIAVLESSIKFCSLWSLFHIFMLTTNMRANNDTAFSDWLLQIGNGTIPSLGTPTKDTIEIPREIISTDVISDIYGDNLKPENMLNYSYCAILCPKNDDCDHINDIVLEKVEGEEHEYCSVDDIECDDPAEKRNFPLEFVNSLTPSGMPPHRLRLKIGAIVMLLRNLNPMKGLCNGTRLIVTGCFRHTISARILTGDYQGNDVLIPRITLAPSDINMPFIIKRRQFPIRLSFAMTINKSQGQTFSKIGLFLRQPVFSHGQLYVAFSRVQSFNDLKVQIVNGEKQGVNNDICYTSNVVCQDIL